MQFPANSGNRLGPRLSVRLPACPVTPDPLVLRQPVEDTRVSSDTLDSVLRHLFRRCEDRRTIGHVFGMVRNWRLCDAKSLKLKWLGNSRRNFTLRTPEEVEASSRPPNGARTVSAAKQATTRTRFAVPWHLPSDPDELEISCK